MPSLPLVVPDPRGGAGDLGGTPRDVVLVSRCQWCEGPAAPSNLHPICLDLSLEETGITLLRSSPIRPVPSLGLHAAFLPFLRGLVAQEPVHDGHYPQEETHEEIYDRPEPVALPRGVLRATCQFPAGTTASRVTGQGWTTVVSEGTGPAEWWLYGSSSPDGRE